MAMRRRLIPDPQGALTAVSASGVTMVESKTNDTCHSGLDTFAGPWGADTLVEQFGNGRATLTSMSGTCGRQLVGKMKNGR